MYYTVSGIITPIGDRPAHSLREEVSLLTIPLHVSSTIMFIFRRTIVLVQHLVSSLSLGDCSIHRLREESARNLRTERSPKDSDDA